MKYLCTAHLHDGPVVAEIEANSFFYAIRAHRGNIMREQETKLERDQIWNCRVTAVKVDEATVDEQIMLMREYATKVTEWEG